MANRPSEGSRATRQALDDPSRDNIAHYLRGTLPTCASCFSATAGIGRRSRSQPSGPHSRSPTGCFYHQPRDLPSLETLRRANVALIKPVDPTDPAVADIIADWKAKKGTVGVRIIMNDKVSTDPADPGVNRVLAAAAKHSLAVNLLCWGRLEQAGQLAARNPNTRLVIDHLGLQQPFAPPPAQPWAELPKMLALAAHPNVAIKITGACTLSHDPFPYKGIWDPLGRIFDAFSFDRCLWGTDWTRAIKLLTYAEGLDAFRRADRLSDGDRAKLMSGTASRIYNWSPSKA
jgi:L-fuconolactonase